MCGICGEIHNDRARLGDRPLLEEMIAALTHRGPDSRGVVTGPGFGLGACRLAIIDPDPRADQPLSSEDGKLHLVFNGEIYNFAPLRNRLEEKGHRFRSRGDAEVVLHLFEEKGADCLRDLRGMFAFAIWDEREGTLFAARDRVGQKPLFYCFAEGPAAPDTPAALRIPPGGSLLFASEIKALLRHPACRPEPDLDAIDAYLSLGYVPGETTAFAGIRRLPPAHFLRWKAGRVSIRRWWRLARAPKLDVAAHGGEEGLARELRERIDEAVRLRLVSDAPLGILLSGGVDSSAVTALAAAAGTPRTFAIGFDEKEYDELPHAGRVAALFETRHAARRLRPDAASLLPRLVRHLEEPFADSSALATYCAAELAGRDVKVLLTGDGGDESFAGYLRYGAHRLATAAASFLPAAARAAAARAALRLPGLRAGPAGSARGGRSMLRRFLAHAAEPGLDRYFSWVSLLGPGEKKTLLSEDFLAERALAAAPIPARFRSAWHAAAATGGTDALDRVLDVDLATYLPGDLLVKMDRMCMACSVEARSPFLDHELIEFAARIPGRLKLHGFFGTKHILKRAFSPLLPPAVLDRPKAGFAVPIDHWLRRSLRDLSHDILLDGTARSRGIVRPAAVAALLDSHATGRINAHHEIWALLMLELWFREFVDRSRK